MALKLQWSPVKRGPGYWKLNVSVLQNEQYCTMIHTVITDWLRDRHRLSSPQVAWDVLKFRVRSLSQVFCKDAALFAQAAHAETRDMYEHTLHAWSADPSSSNAANLSDAREALQQDADAIYTSAAIRARVRWHEEGERATRYFCQLERESGAASTISALLDPATGATFTAPAELCNIASSFYSSLYRPDHPPVDDAAVETLLRHIPTLSPAQSLSCDAPLSADEISRTLFASPPGKTPGLDGLPKEFYEAFWPQLRDPMLQLFANILESGLLPLSMR